MSSSLRRDRRQSQTLLHDGHGHEERGGDLLLGLAFVAQGLECAELVEGVKRRALDVLGEAILLGDAAFTNDTRDGRRLGQALLLHQEFQRPIAAAAGGNLEHAGLVALGVANRPDRDALQQGATGDVLGQLLDRDAGLDPPHVGLTEQELVERDIARRAEDDLLKLEPWSFSMTGGRETLSRPSTRHEKRRSPLTLAAPRQPTAAG